MARGTLWPGESERERERGCGPADWDEDHWGEEAHVREGRGKDTINVWLAHTQNHLWHEVCVECRAELEIK